MPLSIKEYLLHILEEADFPICHSKSLDRDTFEEDEVLKRAFVRCLEVIGEAVTQLSENVRQQHPEIEWKLIAGMRDRLIHEYFGVNYDIVWDAVTAPGA